MSSFVEHRPKPDASPVDVVGLLYLKGPPPPSSPLSTMPAGAC